MAGIEAGMEAGMAPTHLLVIKLNDSAFSFSHVHQTRVGEKNILIRNVLRKY